MKLRIRRELPSGLAEIETLASSFAKNVSEGREVILALQRSFSLPAVEPYPRPDQVVRVLGEDAVQSEEGLEDLVPLPLQVQIPELVGVEELGHVDHVEEVPVWGAAPAVGVEAVVDVSVFYGGDRLEIGRTLDPLYRLCVPGSAAAHQYVIWIPGDDLLDPDVDAAPFALLGNVNAASYLQGGRSL